MESPEQTGMEDYLVDQPPDADPDAEYKATPRRLVGRNPAVWFVSLALFINGVVGILQVLVTRFPTHARVFGVLLPFGVFHWSRTLTLTLGFMLIYLSLRLLQRRTVAWWIAVSVSGLAMVTHLGQYQLWYTAIAPAVTLVVLFLYRTRFTVRTEPRSVIQGFALLGLSVVVVISYGTLGFWFLNRRDFGVDFEFTGAVVRTLREFLLIGNSDLFPATGHARWFLESFHIFGITAASMAAYSLFRPVAYRLVSLPHERARARQIVAQWGCSSYDYFKTWPDKSFFFSETGKSFLSYRASMGAAVCLGDPVGPACEMERIIGSFVRFCMDNGWLVAFFLPDQVPLYRKLGFSLLKIGESAVVDLEQFCENTANKKYFRYVRKKMEGDGYRLTRHTPPHAPSLIDEVEQVSKTWLGLPGHREFGFIQGSFSREYVAGAPLSVLRDPAGRAIAFVNEVPSSRAGEATIDMMRHVPGVHWGAMDYIFQALMQTLRLEGYRTFYLGLAGIADKPGRTLVEKAIYQISNHFNFLVHSKGVRRYKEKFEPHWENRYLVYRGFPTALAKIALAMIRVL
jgi:phosphatidylglycerol lysyltransferase